MRRDVHRLTDTVYDLLIIGGGIYGACAARDAVLRGLSVALVDKGDFGHATSANSMKIIHGGFRYLQHADVARIRESIQERRTLLRIAPHLVRPLPCIMPTYGHGITGPEALRVALTVYDALGADRNRGLTDASRRVPRGRLLSRRECLRLVPGVRGEGLTGGAVWYDAQMLNSERLTLAFVRSAAQAGAAVANYVHVTGLLREARRVVGVDATDALSGEPLQIRARLVLNTSGPWMSRVADGAQPRSFAAPQFCKTLNLVIRRPIVTTYALAVSTPSGAHDRLMDHDALIRRKARFLYISPWRGRAVIGSPHTRYEGDPDALHTGAEEVQGFLEEINHAYPAANLTPDDVSFVHQGLLPMSPRASANGAVELLKKPMVRDHAGEGCENLISVLGVKYTTARLVAERTVDLVCRRLGRRSPQSASAERPVCGGAIDRLETFLSQAVAARPRGVSAQTIQHLAEQYGTEYGSVLRIVSEDPAFGQPLSGATPVIGAEVVHAVRFEMAQTLCDVVFRRTDLGSAGDPGELAIWVAAAIMARECAWSPDRKTREIETVQTLFGTHRLTSCRSR